MSYSKPIRILHNVGSISAGGMEALIMNYYRHIDRSKVQFDFMVRLPEMKSSYYEKEIINLGGRVYRLPIYNTETRSFFMGELFRFLKQNPEYKIIHSHPDISSVFYLMVAKTVGVPVRIAHSHSIDFDRDWKGIVKKCVKSLINNCCTHRFACSQEAGTWLFGNDQKDNIKIIPNAIETDVFQYNKLIRKESRNELNMKNSFIIGNIAKFGKQKNHDFLIDIFREIRKVKTNAQLVLIGDGELRTKIQNKVNDLGLQKHVLFLGIRNDVPRLLNGFDILLFPSLSEGFGFVLLEAQASGLKCFVSDTVPEDAKISSLCKTIPLEKSPKEWAEIILNNVQYNRYSGHDLIKLKGYDIKDNVKWLEDFYITQYEINRDRGYMDAE